MGIELRTGDRVIHDGMTKVIEEIHGEVMILNDKSVVRSEDVSFEAHREGEPIETSEDENIAQMHQNERDALRRNIEELTEESAAVAVFAMMQEVDTSITLATLESLTVEAMKKRLLHLAVSIGKIDPKKCGECGQNVPE